MGKASWNDAIIARRNYSPSMLTHQVPGATKRAVHPRGHIPLRSDPPPFREPQKLDVDGVRWFAVRTIHAHERALQGELEGIGYRVYCPLVTKWLWRNGNRTKEKRQTPVFTRYIFVGCAPRQYVSRHTADAIEGVFGAGTWRCQRCGNLSSLTETGTHQAVAKVAKKILGAPVCGGDLAEEVIPPDALRYINDLDLAGEWDETIEWSPDKSAFQPGMNVRIRKGPFDAIKATVDIATSEKTIRLLITLIGRETTAEFEACNLEFV